MKLSYKILVGNLKRTDHMQSLYIDGRIIMKWILRKQNMRVLPGFIWGGIGYTFLDVVNEVMKLPVPQMVWNFLTSLVTVRFQRRWRPSVEPGNNNKVTYH